MTRQTSNRQAGFTLVEMLVVLAIIGMLAGLVGPQVMKYLGGARSEAAEAQMRNLMATLDLYRLDNGRYPDTEEGLQALLAKPVNAARWSGPYLRKEDAVLDPWGRAYRYRSPGQYGEFDLYTLGADNAEGGEGENKDIASW